MAENPQTLVKMKCSVLISSDKKRYDHFRWMTCSSGGQCPERKPDLKYGKHSIKKNQDECQYMTDRHALLLFSVSCSVSFWLTVFLPGPALRARFNSFRVCLLRLKWECNQIDFPLSLNGCQEGISHSGTNTQSGHLV